MPVYIWLCIYDCIYDSSVTHISNSNNSSPILRSMLTLSLCYLKGESPHTGNSHKFTYSIHLQFSQQFSFFKWSHNFLITDFPLFFVAFFFFFCSLCFFFCFFSERCVTGLWFTHYSQCTGSVLWQNRSLSLFPLLTEDHRAKFNANNKITGAQNTHFHIHRSFI